MGQRGPENGRRLARVGRENYGRSDGLGAPLDRRKQSSVQLGSPVSNGRVAEREFYFKSLDNGFRRYDEGIITAIADVRAATRNKWKKTPKIGPIRSRR